MKLNLKDIKVLNSQNYQKIIYDWNKTEAECPQNKTAVDLFEEQAAKTPDNTAAVYENIRLTYRELNEAANRLGFYLAEKYDIKPDDLIALCLDRSELMLISILGVLKAGAAYVPILPEYPAERIGYMLKDTGAKAVLANGKHKQKLIDTIGDNKIKIETIDDDDFVEKLKMMSEANPIRKAAHENLAYVIYTSGTTGKPKGTMLEHSGLTNLALHQGKLFGLEESEKQKHCLWYANYVFDAHVSEVFTALCNGYSLYILADEQRMDLVMLNDYVKKNNISIGTIPPALLDRETILALEIIVMAGEVSGRELMDSYAQQGARVINAYGPTESTVCATIHYYQKGDTNKNIGRPITNIKCYILNENMQPVPVGAAGELHIGGAGLARGYLNKPELTMEKFILNPFQSEEEKAKGCNGRLYKTGDLARYLPDGNIEYLGRNDSQVKIRGYRIELGEIENVLNGYDEVKQCAVLAREREGNKYLAAYYTGEANAGKLREYLEGKLPDYMVPDSFVQLAEMPLTVNGKLDRNALPEPDMQDVNEYEPPANEIEKALQKIFAQVLGLEENKLSVTADFFRLGGNSIIAIKLANRIQRHLDMEVKVADIFSHKSVRNLSESLGKGQRERIGKAVFSRIEDQRLSFAQGRLWFIENYEGGSNAYNIPMSAQLKEGVSAEGVKKALREIVRRHEVLRSIIRTDESGEAYQDTLDAELEVIEEQYESREAAEQAIKKETLHIFKLAEEIPIRAKLYTAGKNIFISIVLHHIAFDGWSMDIFIKELEALYKYYENGGAITGGECPLPELEIQYKDYAAWQSVYLRGGALEKQIEYWKKKLGNYETLNLITDKERPASQQYEGGTVSFEFDKKTSEKIKECARELGVSVYTVLLSGYGLLLSAYSGQKDIVIGTLNAGREREETAGMIGFFVNTIAMRLQLDIDKNGAEYIKEVGEEIAQAQRNGEAPFDRVVEALGVEADRSRHPVFQAAFLFQEEWVGGKGLFTEIGGEQEAVKFDLQLGIAEGEKRIKAEIQYATSLFEHNTAERYAYSYKHIVTSLVEGKQKAIKEINFISADEYKKIINEWNNTEREYPHNKTIVDLFEEQAAKTPDNIAVVYEDKKLTYRELNERANRLGLYLVAEYSIKPDDFVVLCLGRSELMLISILGVLKAGAAYVPILPEYPTERIKYMLKDTGTKAVLVNVKHKQKLIDAIGDNEIKIETIDDDTFAEKLKAKSAANPVRRASPENPAHIIYTSGTTGEPKGVMIEHRGLTNHLCWMNSEYPLRETDRVLQKTAYIFDVSAWDLLWAILHGAGVVFAVPGGHLDSVYVTDVIQREQVTVIQFVPSMLAVFEEVVGSMPDLAKRCSSIRYIFCAGEALSLTYVREGQRLFPNAQIHNLYGPSETTIAITNYPCHDPQIREVLIGRPIGNCTCYILDEQMRPVPEGAVGELHLGGVQLARGYLNKPELTAEKFIPNPFQSEEEKARGYNGRLYKTGDLTRYRSGGNIEYLGRNDFQVKIRGNRIELGEIENAINGFEGIKQNTVLAREREGNKYLAAYYVGEADTEALIKYLKDRLPEYMVPGAFMRLTELPLTANGKLDRRALPEPDMQDSNEYDPPANETETELQKIFAQVLGLPPEKVSVNGDFFRMGGDSIRSIQLVSRLRRQLGLELTVKDIFAQKTIRNLAQRLRISQASVTETEQGVLLGTAPLLPVQKWFFSKAEDGSFKKPGHFNQAFTIETPELDVELLRISVIKLVEWHDAFRLRYRKNNDGNIEQYYTEETAAPELKLADINGKTDNEIESILSGWQSGFTLYGDELYSIGYLSANGKGLIHIAMHHLIVDAVSWRILKDDLQQIYLSLIEQKKNETIPVEHILGEKGTSYRQWAQIVDRLGQQVPEKEREYWAEITGGMRKYQEKLLSLDTGKRGQCELRFDRSITDSLGSEVNDLLLAAVMTALGELTGESEQYVTVEGHGRDGEESADLSRTTGWFTVMYPVRVCAGTDLQKTAAMTKEALRETRGKGLLFGALYGYEKNLPGVVYNYLGQFETQTETASRNWVFGSSGSGKTVSEENDDGNILVLTAGIIGGELAFGIEGRIPDSRLKQFALTLQKTLESLTAEPKTFPLFPSQQNLFNSMKYSGFPLEYFNAQVVVSLMSIDNADEYILRQSLVKLVEYHDTFRIKYQKDENGRVSQYYDDTIPEVNILKLDIGSLNNADEKKTAVKDTINIWKKKIDIFSGNLFLFGLITGFEEKKARLYTLIHHLNTDAFSWRILEEDLFAIYNFLLKNNERSRTNVRSEAILGPKGTSCRRWINALLEYKTKMETDACYAAERSYWKEIERATIISNEKLNKMICGTVYNHHFTLSSELTGRIMQAIRKSAETRIDAILLTALNIALHKMTGINNHCITAENHGRQDFAGDIDISRTMGWFAAPYPVKLPSAEGGIADVFSEVQKTLRMVPNEGIGAKVLRLNEEKISALPAIYFNYQGEYESGMDTEIDMYDDDIINSRSEHTLMLVGRIYRKQFSFELFSKLPEDKTIQLIKDFTAVMEKLV